MRYSTDIHALSFLGNYSLHPGDENQFDLTFWDSMSFQAPLAETLL